MAKWKIVTNAVSQESVLEPLLFNILTSGIDSGTEASLQVIPNWVVQFMVMKEREEFSQAWELGPNIHEVQ